MNRIEIKFQDKVLCIGISFFLILDLLIPQYGVLWIGLLFMLEIFYLLFHYRTINIKVNATGFLWYIFLIILVFGLIIPEIIFPDLNVNSTLTHVTIIFIAVSTYILLISSKHWQVYMGNLFVIVGVFFVVGSIWQLISPKTLLAFNKLISTTEHYEESYNFISKGILSGFTFNPAMNGFMISILFLYFFIQLFRDISKVKKIIILLLFLFTGYLLILTNKRGFIIFTIVIMGYLIFRLSKSKLQSLTVFAVIGIAFLALLLFSEGGQVMIARTLGQSDITTGRMPVYKVMWENFSNYPIFGTGTYTTKSFIEINNGHNIYLQVLSENGVFGFAVLFLLFSYNLIKADRKLKNCENINERLIIALSISIQLLFVMWGVTGNPLFDRYPLIIYVVGLSMYERIECKESVRDINDREFLRNNTLDGKKR